MKKLSVYLWSAVFIFSLAPVIAAQEQSNDEQDQEGMEQEMPRQPEMQGRMPGPWNVNAMPPQGKEQAGMAQQKNMPKMGKMKNMGKMGNKGKNDKNYGEMEAFCLSEPELMSLIQETSPELFKKVNAMKKESPEKFNQLTDRLSHQLFFAKQEGKSDEVKQVVSGILLDMQIKDLADDYRKAGDKDKAKIKADIQSKINELFDIRMAEREARLAKIEAKIKEAKDNLAERKAAKKTIVEQQVDSMTDQVYKW